MRNVLVALSGALAVAAVAPAASAQTAADKSDIRCILALSVATRDAKNAEAAKQAAFYFWGRLSARGAKATPAVMMAEAKTMATGQLIQAELKRCGSEVTASSQKLGAAMKGFQEAAQAAEGAAKQPATPAPK
jgi:hypothetical protein